MPLYELAFWYTEGGRVTVFANSLDEAINEFENHLDEEGIDNIVIEVKYGYDVTHREFQVWEEKEVELKQLEKE